jgi:hypothetical protein
MVTPMVLDRTNNEHIRTEPKQEVPMITMLKDFLALATVAAFSVSALFWMDAASRLM